MLLQPCNDYPLPPRPFESSAGNGGCHPPRPAPAAGASARHPEIAHHGEAPPMGMKRSMAPVPVLGPNRDMEPPPWLCLSMDKREKPKTKKQTNLVLVIFCVCFLMFFGSLPIMNQSLGLWLPNIWLDQMMVWQELNVSGVDVCWPIAIVYIYQYIMVICG